MLTRNIAEPEIRQARFWLTMQNPELPTRPDALFFGLDHKDLSGFPAASRRHSMLVRSTGLPEGSADRCG